MYAYCLNVYKSKLTEEEERKLKSVNDLKATAKRGCRLELRYNFSEEHPQSASHLQRICTEPDIPSLSFFPQSENYDEERFHMTPLVLFKPFTSFHKSL